MFNGHPEVANGRGEVPRQVGVDAAGRHATHQSQSRQLSTLDFADWIGLPVPDELANVRAWRERVSARPSAAA